MTLYDPSADPQYLDFWYNAVQSSIANIALSPYNALDLTYLTQADDCGSLEFSMDDYVRRPFHIGTWRLANMFRLASLVATFSSAHAIFNTSIVLARTRSKHWHSLSPSPASTSTILPYLDWVQPSGRGSMLRITHTMCRGQRMLRIKRRSKREAISSSTRNTTPSRRVLRASGTRIASLVNRSTPTGIGRFSRV